MVGLYYHEQNQQEDTWGWERQSEEFGLEAAGTELCNTHVRDDIR